MLEKPELQDELIISRLHDGYGLRIAGVAFLPLGADLNTAVYRVVADDGRQHFLKLRRGVFDETAVAVPKFLSDRGIAQVMAPIATRTQGLWTSLDALNLILYPFIEGHSGFDVDLSDRQWVELGATLKSIHTTVLPSGLSRRVQQETYSPQWRDSVKTFQARIEGSAYNDPVAAKLAAFLQTRREEIQFIVERAEQLGTTLQRQASEFVLCHADIHAGNVLIGANDELYIVDWDTSILAPKERDLMFVGGGVGGVWHEAREEASFYQGYGKAEIDPVALAYYRYERIVQDIATTCEQIFLTAEGGEDREEGLQNLMSQFLPDNVVEIAHKSDKIVGSIDLPIANWQSELLKP